MAFLRWRCSGWLTNGCVTAPRIDHIPPDNSLPRGRLFAFVYLLLTANALPTFLGTAVQAHGLAGAALNLFDVSVIVWLAIAGGLALVWGDQTAGELRRADWLVAAGSGLIALFPAPPASAAVVPLVALWAWSTSQPGSAFRRGAAVFLSLSAFLFWGRVALAAGSNVLLAADAQFVGLISGMAVDGNRVEFVDGRGFVIAPGCSSLHGISLALILWTLAVMWFNVKITRQLRVTLALAIGVTIVINALRLTAIAWYPQDFDYWHVGTGAAWFGGIALCAILAVVYRGIAKAMP